MCGPSFPLLPVVPSDYEYRQQTRVFPAFKGREVTVCTVCKMPVCTPRTAVVCTHICQHLSRIFLARKLSAALSSQPWTKNMCNSGAFQLPGGIMQPCRATHCTYGGARHQRIMRRTHQAISYGQPFGARSNSFSFQRAARALIYVPHIKLHVLSAPASRDSFKGQLIKCLTV